jgi:phosphate-selective porin OprO/OprP
MAITLACLALLQDPEPAAGYDNGFFIRGRSAKLRLEGLLQVNGTAFERGGPHAGEFELRRMRLEFSGEFHHRWLFHLEPKFSEDGVDLEEAWIGIQLGDHRLHVGRMKEPFSLEEMASLRHMDMINFSILNQFVPAEDHGLTLLGRVDFFEYGVGFYNGTGGEDTTSDKDGAVRLVLHPAGGFQFGGSGTIGRQETDVAGAELTTEARAPWAEYQSGTMVTGTRVRLGVEAALLEGPWAVTAEWIAVREELNDESVRLRGGYVQASWVVTGEAKTWKGVIPDRPFNEDPDIGAWQIVGRWSIFDPDGDFESFLTSAPDRIDTGTVGVNWYANDHAKVKLNWVHTRFADRILIDGESLKAEDALIVQFQIQF